MIEETGVVVQVEGRYAWVETQSKSACGHCNVGENCGTSLLGKWFGRKRNRIQVCNHLDLQQGDFAVVGISNEMLIKASFLVYILPLMLMVTIATVFSQMQGTNAVVISGSLSGFLAGLFLVKRLSQYMSAGVVKLVRKAPPQNTIPLEIYTTERG